MWFFSTILHLNHKFNANLSLNKKTSEQICCTLNYIVYVLFNTVEPVPMSKKFASGIGMEAIIFFV